MNEYNVSDFQIDEMDMFAFCGTSTGDIVKIKLNFHSDVNILDPVSNPVLLGCYGKRVKVKRWAAGEETARYSQGECALRVLTDTPLIGYIRLKWYLQLARF
jgi:hypothetical protein